MSHALQPFSTGSQSSGSPTSAPPSRTSTFTDNETTGPSTFGALSLHGEDENVVSPVSMNSAFSTFFTPPGSCSASDGLSPRSTTSDRSQFGAFPNSENTSPECVSPFIRSRGFSTAYSSHPHTTSLQIHEPKSRPRGEMLASPFRSSSAYQRSPEAYADFQPTSTRNPSTSNVSSQPHWDVESNRSIYGVGYSSMSSLNVFRSFTQTSTRWRLSACSARPGSNRPDYHGPLRFLTASISSWTRHARFHAFGPTVRELPARDAVVTSRSSLHTTHRVLSQWVGHCDFRFVLRISRAACARLGPGHGATSGKDHRVRRVVSCVAAASARREECP